MSRTPSSRELIAATSGGGRCRFGIRGDKCVRVCLLCDAEFEQTDEGFDALKEHEFTHGMGTLFDWGELHGRTLRLVVVAYDTELMGLYSGEADLYGIDDERGIAYHLEHKYGSSYTKPTGATGWKWKIGKATTRDDGPKAMPHALALQLLGSRSTVEK